MLEQRSSGRPPAVFGHPIYLFIYGNKLQRQLNHRTLLVSVAIVQEANSFHGFVESHFSWPARTFVSVSENLQRFRFPRGGTQ